MRSRCVGGCGLTGDEHGPEPQFGRLRLRRICLDDDFSPEVPNLDPHVRLPREDLRDIIGHGRNSGALSRGPAGFGGRGET